MVATSGRLLLVVLLLKAVAAQNAVPIAIAPISYPVPVEGGSFAPISIPALTDAPSLGLSVPATSSVPAMEISTPLPTNLPSAELSSSVSPTGIPTMETSILVPTEVPTAETPTSFPALNDGTNCTLCPGGESVPFPDTIVVGFSVVGSTNLIGISLTCLQLQQFMAQETNMDGGSCSTAAYDLGVEKCGCAETRPKAQCTLCQDGSFPTNAFVSLGNDTNCASWIDLIKDEQDKDVCDAFQKFAAPYCGCDYIHTINDDACRVCGQDIFLPDPSANDCGMLELDANLNKDLCEEYTDLFGDLCCSLNSTTAQPPSSAPTISPSAPLAPSGSNTPSTTPVPSTVSSISPVTSPPSFDVLSIAPISRSPVQPTSSTPSDSVVSAPDSDTAPSLAAEESTPPTEGDAESLDQPSTTPDLETRPSSVDSAVPTMPVEMMSFEPSIITSDLPPVNIRPEYFVPQSELAPCGMLCSDKRPLPYPDAIAFTEAGLNITCRQLENLLASNSSLFKLDCEVATYIGASACGCNESSLSESNCTLCEDGSSVPYASRVLDKESGSCAHADVKLGDQILEEDNCQAYQATAGVYCGCNNSIASDGICRICGGDTLLPDPSLIADNTTNASCLSLEFNMNHLRLNCQFYQTLYSPACCDNLTAVQPTTAPTPASTAPVSENAVCFLGITLLWTFVALTGVL